jgi:hypothetical protein
MSEPHKGFDFSSLSSAERVLIAQELLGSVLAGIQNAGQAHFDDLNGELRRRIAGADAGQVAEENWEDVKAELFPGI